ncbi:MAG: hypothetical protein RJA98_633 [Pseudomonadota bacterium]|jgi:hypothetical protein
MRRGVLEALCRIRFAPCPPPAFGQLLLNLRKANAAQRFLNPWWHAKSTPAKVMLGR